MTINVNDLHKYLEQVNEAIFQSNSSVLCHYFSYRHEEHVSKIKGSNACEWFDRYGRVVQGWNPILVNHVRLCQIPMFRKRLNEIYQCQFNICRTLLDLVKESKNKNWHIPLLILTLTELRLLTNVFTRSMKDHNRIDPNRNIGDLSIEDEQQTAETNVNRTVEILTEAFRVCTSDRCTDQQLSKKWGAIQILNQLLKLCHRIKRYELGEQPISFAEASLEFRHHLLQDQKMTYDYFLGKSHFYKDDFRKATECFDPIFQRCSKSMFKNKASILIHLCISKMQFGYTPSLAIVRKYQLNALYDLLVAVKNGHLIAFDECVKNKHRQYFLAKGLLFQVETLYLIAVRNLFRQVWILFNKENKITVESFARALQLSTQSQSLEQMECLALLSTLISQNRLKAYISYKHMTVVLSKEDPFPKLQQVL